MVQPPLPAQAAAPQAAQPAVPAAPAPDAQPQGQERDDDQTYNNAMTAALAQLYSDGQYQSIAKSLKADPQNLAQTIGHMTAMMLKSIVGNAQQSGVTIADDIVLQVGQSIVAELCEMAAALKLAKEADVELFKRACFEAAKAYGDDLLRSGKITPEVQAQAKQRIQEGMAQEKSKGGAIGGAMQPQEPPEDDTQEGA